MNDATNENDPLAFPARQTHYVLGFAFIAPNNLFEASTANVLLIKKTRPEWQKGYLNGIGGKIHDQEPPNHAMAREFREETTLKTLPSWWQCFHTMSFPQATVWCYSTFSVDFGDARRVHNTTMDEGKIKMCRVAALKTQLYRGCLYNLSWLIPMALDRDYGGVCYTAARPAGGRAND